MSEKSKSKDAEEEVEEEGGKNVGGEWPIGWMRQ